MWVDDLSIGLRALSFIAMFGPAMASGDASACVSFRRSVLAELALISLVLAMTATLTTLYSPT